MRHIRMLGLAVVAALAACAVAATGASALKNPTKSPKILVNCPVNSPQFKYADEHESSGDCIFGATESGEGGQFTVSGITVPLAKQIILQYGLAFGTPQEEKEKEEKGESSTQIEHFVPPANGAEAITPTPEKVPGEPIGHISEAEQNELGWPEGMKYSYKSAQKHGLVKTVYETIEGAGPDVTSVQNILEREGVGVEAPVMIKVENKWLSALGDVCTIGSEEDPIVQKLTSGQSTSPKTGETIEGTTGEAAFVSKHGELQEVYLTHSDLVDNTYAVPAATCTGKYAAAVTATINKVFGLPAEAGASVTELKGTLYTASSAFGELGGAGM